MHRTVPLGLQGLHEVRSGACPKHFPAYLFTSFTPRREAGLVALQCTTPSPPH